MRRRDRILFVASAICYYSGLMYIIQFLHRRAGRRLIVLNYHLAAGKELREHLLYLRKHFRLQFLDQGLEELYSKDRPTVKDRRLPLAVTFDDGYVDNYTIAYELVRELQVPMTIFLISNYIENGSAFWWFDHLIEKAQVIQVTLDGRTYHLENFDEQQELAQMIDAQVNALSDEQARQAYVQKLGEMFLLSPANLARLKDVPVPMLTWEQIQAMQSSEWINFGGHTLHHATLSRVANESEACQEVAGCRAFLQEKLGLPEHVLAYPHGATTDVGARGVLAAQRAGYRWAVTTLQGVNTPQTHPYMLRRMPVDSETHWLVIAFVTSGLWDLLSYFNWRVKRIKYRQALKEMRIFDIY